MQIQDSGRDLTLSEMKALKSVLMDKRPMPLPPDSSNGVVVELHEMLLEFRHFVSSMAAGNLSMILGYPGYMASTLKSLQGNLRQLILQPLPDTDGLTGLYNHEFLLNSLEIEIERARRYNAPLSIIMMDIDQFKKFNGTYSPKADDDVLEITAKLTRQLLRPPDIAGRFKNGNFMLILPNTDCDGAYILAERIRSNIAKTPFTDSDLRVTVSAGIARWGDQKLAGLIQAATDNLDEAKRNGRNQICAGAT